MTDFWSWDTPYATIYVMVGSLLFCIMVSQAAEYQNKNWRKARTYARWAFVMPLWPLIPPIFVTYWIIRGFVWLIKTAVRSG